MWRAEHAVVVAIELGRERLTILLGELEPFTCDDRAPGPVTSFLPLRRVGCGCDLAGSLILGSLAALVSDPAVGASRPASVYWTGAAIERPLLVLAQRPVALARPTMPAAHDVTAPDAPCCNYNGAGRMAEDAPARNQHLHLFLRESFAVLLHHRPEPVEGGHAGARAHTCRRERRTASQWTPLAV